MALAGGLTPLKLPKLGQTNRRQKRPRPEYSVDIRGERRKRKRITIQELSEKGVEILKERAPDLPRMDKRSLFTKVTDILDIPRNAIANAIAAASGMDISGKRKGAFLKKVYMSDILDKAGVEKGAARSIIGFVGDVAIDPLTYASLGGSAGLRVAKHLPRFVGGGEKAMKVAARTGKMSTELAKALKMTPAGFAKAYAKRVVKHGEAKTRKMLLQKRGGLLTKQLARRTTKGAPEALEIMAKYGEKARPLFRAPFTKGVIGLPGKRAARYKAVVEGVKEPGRFKRMAGLAARPEKLTGIGKGAAKEIAGLKREARDRAVKAIADMKAKHGPLSATEETNVARMLKAGYKKKAIEAAKPLKEKIVRAGELKKRAVSQYKRFTTSPEAPGVIRQLEKVKKGPAITRGKPGIVPLVTRIKQKLVGAPVTPERQKIVALQQQLGPITSAAAGPAKAAMQKQLAPIISKYAAMGAGTEDDVSRLVYRIIEAGPGGKDLAKMPLTDVMHKSIRKAKQFGMMDDPAIKAAAKDVWRAEAAVQRAKRLPGRAVLPRGVEKPVAQRYGMQAERGMTGPRHAARTKLLTYESPTGEIRKITSTKVNAKAEIAALEAKGWKKTATEAISAEQMGVWAADPSKRPTGLGPEMFAPKVTGQFKESLPEAMGTLASQKELAFGERELVKFAKEHAIMVPKGGLEAAEGYAHTARLTARSGNNPIYQMLNRAGMTKDTAFPVQIANMLDDFTNVWDKPEMVEAIFKGTDRLLGIWKGFQLYHPAYLIRNVFQNLFGGVMAGANPGAVTAMVGRKELRALTNAVAIGDDTAIRGMRFRLSVGDVPMERVYRFLRQNNGVNVGRTAAEITQRFGVVGGAAQRAQKGVTSLVYRINTSLENNMRVATFMHFMDKGMDMESAFMRTLKAMPDLTDLTMFEREGLARTFPWYRWMRRNCALQLFHYLPQKPA
ncbi:MAG: hypothetical protein KAV00_18595, partial [Phycisphaerae bacterium]|nr:hypothetical protein [Phycisphaerae bacterium]